MDFVKELLPVPRLQLRYVLFGLAILPVFLSNLSWPMKAVACIIPAALFGSYRRVRIEAGVIDIAMTVLFVPLRARRLPIKRIACIETEVAERMGIGWIILVGTFWFFSRFFDWAMPWMDGEYKLWLRSSRGKRALAWEGNNEEFFHENLRTLQSATGVAIERTSPAARQVEG